MLTKNDLSQIKTVVQKAILPEIKALKQSTKKDIKTLETGLEAKFETGLKGLETRLNNRIENFRTEIIEGIEESEMEIIATVDKHKADKEIVGVLEKRVVRLEDNAGLSPLPTQYSPHLSFLPR